MAQDDQLVVEVPTDIELGFDADGLPKAVAKNGGAQKSSDHQIEWSEDDRRQIEVLKREREASEREKADLRQREADARAQITAEREARSAAEQTAEKNRLGKMRAEYDLLHSDHQQIMSAINANKIELTAAETDLQTALTNADYETAAKIQTKIGKLAAFDGQLEQAKGRAERAIDDAKRYIEKELSSPQKTDERGPEPEKKEIKQLTPDEWIENVRTSVGGTLANWLKDHREFVTDPKLHNRMLKFADAYVHVEEKPLNDIEFIKELEAKFLSKKTEVDVDDTQDDGAIVIDTEPKRQSTAVAAPVSRATSPARSSTTNQSLKVRLTADQASMATALYPNLPQEEARKRYAENLLRAQKDQKFASRE